MSESVRVIARFKVREENVGEFVDRVRTLLVEPARKEEGCIAYDLWQDRADPTRFAMVEEWESDAGLDSHLAQESLRAALAQLMPLGEGEVEIQRLRSVTPV